MVLAHDVTEGQRTRDIEIHVDVTFESMLLSDNTLKGLKDSGFHKPSPIQLHGIPLGKCGFDLFLEAKSGTGKTAVFTVIALENLDLNKGLQVVILAPTREIAAQVADVIKHIGSSFKGLNVEVVLGGLPVEEDIKKLKRNVHILVGSPGRMRHLIQDKHVQLSAVQLFVLDEADKLMDKSFQADINYIFSAMPKEKQVIMSSATYPETLKNTMQNYVQKAQRICPDSNSILLGIKQLVTVVPSNVNIVRQTLYKFKELLKILSKKEFRQCLIFCNYQSRVIELCTMLMREKWPTEQLHGQLDQNDRLDALKTLQGYKCRILVSTDVASRGIDASNVDLVINFEPPMDWPTYLHRIGRAGRYGSYGLAINILSKVEVKHFRAMIKSIDVPINLCYLWNENTFELCDSDQISTTTLKLSNSIEKIEKLNFQDLAPMCRTSKIIGDEIVSKDSGKQLLDLSKFRKEDTNNLFDSFKKFKECKIESFKDLVASFKGHDPNNNERIQVPVNITDKQCKVSEISGSIQPKSIQDSNCSTDFKSKLKKNNSCIDSVTIYTEREERAGINDFREHTQQNGGILKTNSILPENERYASDSDSFSQALRAAGLPTSFGSKKYGKSNRKNECKLNRFHNLDEKADTFKADRYEKEQFSSKTNSNTKETYNEKSSRIVPSLNKDRQNSSNMIVLNSCNENKYKNEKKYDTYITWYKTLKAHVKHVEMGLYINELS